jgi:hypothetical protein
VNDLYAFAIGLSERLRRLLASKADNVSIVSAADKATIDIVVDASRSVRVVVYANGPVKIGAMSKPRHYDFHRVVNLWSVSSVDKIVSAVLDLPCLKRTPASA